MKAPLKPPISVAMRKSLTAFICLLIAVTICALAPVFDQRDSGSRTKAYAASEWIEDGSYWYYYIDGSPATGWQEIYHSGEWDWFFFEDGRMRTGWLEWDGSWFYLADWYGQGVSFNDSDYGVCRYGWEEIYHYGRTDYYHFKDYPSGRMDTDWLDYDGYTYYLSGNEMGTSFYSSEYGVMLVGLHTIGSYKYIFKNDDLSGFYLPSLAQYPHGAMFRDCIVPLVFAEDVVVGYARVDSNGRAYVYSWSDMNEDVSSDDLMGGSADGEVQRLPVLTDSQATDRATEPVLLTEELLGEDTGL